MGVDLITMPEPITLVSEFPKTQVEVLHQGKLELLANRNVISAQELEYIQRLVSKIEIEGLPLIGEHGEYPQIRVDNKDNPRYVFKQRIIIPIPSIEGFIGTDASLKRLLLEKRTGLANNSVLNEIALSEAIEKTIMSSQAQELAHQLGFDSLQFVSPLLGIINSETARKNIVYKYIKGSPLNFETAVIHNLTRDKTHIFITELQRIFRSRQIEPSDLGSHQFIADENRLYLLDAELYWRKY